MRNLKPAVLAGCKDSAQSNHRVWDVFIKFSCLPLHWKEMYFTSVFASNPSELWNVNDYDIPKAIDSYYLCYKKNNKSSRKLFPHSFLEVSLTNKIVYPSVTTTISWLPLFSTKFWNQEMLILQFFFLFKNGVTILVSLQFPINLWNRLPIKLLFRLWLLNLRSFCREGPFQQC